MIRAGKIEDGKTMIGFLTWLRYKSGPGQPVAPLRSPYRQPRALRDSPYQFIRPLGTYQHALAALEHQARAAIAACVIDNPARGPARSQPPKSRTGRYLRTSTLRIGPTEWSAPATTLRSRCTIRPCEPRSRASSTPPDRHHDGNQKAGHSKLGERKGCFSHTSLYNP